MSYFITAPSRIATSYAPAALAADVSPDVPAELFAPSLEQKLLQPFGATAGTSGVARTLRAVLLGVVAAELDRALVRKGKGHRLDDRYGVIAGLVALIGLEI